MPTDDEKKMLNQIVLRVDDELMEHIVEWGAANERNVSQEIRYRLKKAYGLL